MRKAAAFLHLSDDLGGLHVSDLFTLFLVAACPAQLALRQDISFFNQRKAHRAPLHSLTESPILLPGCESELRLAFLRRSCQPEGSVASSGSSSLEFACEECLDETRCGAHASLFPGRPDKHCLELLADQVAIWCSIII